MAYATVNDVTLFYTDEGSGQPVLLVHGYSCDSHDWNYQIPALLEAGHRVVAVDLRGHGHSSVPAAGYTPQGYASDLAALLNILRTGPVVAVGHSMGGAAVSALAAEHPALVKAIVPVDSAVGMGAATRGALDSLVAALDGPDPAAVAKAFFLGSFYPAASPIHLRTHHARRLEGVDPTVLRQALAGMLNAPDQFCFKAQSEAYLARVGCPALVFRAGSQDPASVAAWERGCYSHPYSRAVGWEGSGHFLHQERPAEFNEILLRWVAGLP